MSVHKRLPLPEALASQRPAALALVGAGLCLAVIVGLLLGSSIAACLMLLAIVGVALLALWSPYWALVLAIAQYAFIPNEGRLLGYFVPNSLQLLAPVAFAAALLQALKNADHDRLALRLRDFVVGGFVLWGLVGLFAVAEGAYWKWYGNRMVLPVLLYFVVRLIPIKHRDVRRLASILLIAIALQSVLMVRESMAGSSPLYDEERGLERDIKAAKGPFPFRWNATAYLVLWPALFVYAIAASKGRRRKLLWGLGLLVVLIACTRTMQRAAPLAGLMGIAFCLLSPRLRRTAFAVLAILAIFYVPWSMGKAGGALLDRFQEKDQSRYAYRTAALNLLSSDSWNPIFGVGWGRSAWTAYRHGTDEEVVAWGDKEGTISEIAQGQRLHNVWLAIPVEFGGVGTLLFLGIMGGLVGGLRQIWRSLPKDKVVDDGLVISVLGSLVALAAIGYYQNIYMMPEATCVLWVFYSLLTNHPQAFMIPKEDEVAPEAKKAAK